jgi:hypothetical protein
MKMMKKQKNVMLAAVQRIVFGTIGVNGQSVMPLVAQEHSPDQEMS